MGFAVKKQDSNGVWVTTPYHFITNHRGDVVEIRDNNLNLVGSYEYDAYGNILKETGDFAKINPIRYASYYYDTETKNYYLKARYYNPDNGSFLALDPHPGDTDDPISQNGYTYANDNPVMMVDPDGDYARLKEILGKYGGIIGYLVSLISDLTSMLFWENPTMLDWSMFTIKWVIVGQFTMIASQLGPIASLVTTIVGGVIADHFTKALKYYSSKIRKRSQSRKSIANLIKRRVMNSIY